MKRVGDKVRKNRIEMRRKKEKIKVKKVFAKKKFLVTNKFGTGAVKKGRGFFRA
jgi:hypothetical protein